MSTLYITLLAMNRSVIVVVVIATIAVELIASAMTTSEVFAHFSLIHYRAQSMHFLSVRLRND